MLYTSATRSVKQSLLKLQLKISSPASAYSPKPTAKKRWSLIGAGHDFSCFDFLFHFSVKLSKRKRTKRSAGKSIAVLAFENLSGDKEQEYFSDGIADEILNALAQIKDLKVAGRTSSFRFKGKAVTIQEVGEKLKVSTVLEGTVRRQGTV